MIKRTIFHQQVKTNKQYFIIDELNDFAFCNYGEKLSDLACEFITPFHLTKVMELRVYALYVWWVIYTKPLTRKKQTVFQQFCRQYIRKNRECKHILYHLKSLNDVRPSFYVVKKVRNDKEFVLYDLVLKNEVHTT